MRLECHFLSLERYKTLCEKKEMLVTSIFFFSHNVFKSLLFLKKVKHLTFRKRVFLALITSNGSKIEFKSFNVNT